MNHALAGYGLVPRMTIDWLLGEHRHDRARTHLLLKLKETFERADDFGEKGYVTTVAKTVCEPTIKTRIETVQREVVRDVPLPKSNILLDGGVGQQVTY